MSSLKDPGSLTFPTAAGFDYSRNCMYSVTIIGIGRVGGALALALPRDKYLIDNLVVRHRAAGFSDHVSASMAERITVLADLNRISSDILLITTKDAEITSVVGDLTGLIQPETTVFHTSGALSSDLLLPLADIGCSVGSIHPLVSISSPELGAERLISAYYCVEGSAKAQLIAEQIVRDLGGTSFVIETEKKALYHAAAVMACGHLVALVDASIELMAKCGPDPTFAKEILGPLVESTVRNLADQTPAAALTGSFARGDVETFSRHLAALDRDASAAIRDIYLLLGERSLELALEQGTDPAAIESLRQRISVAKAITKC